MADAQKHNTQHKQEDLIKLYQKLNECFDDFSYHRNILAVDGQNPQRKHQKFIDELLLDARELHSVDRKDSNVSKLLAILHLLRGDTISALRYSENKSLSSGNRSYAITVSELAKKIDFNLLSFQALEALSSFKNNEALAYCKQAMQIFGERWNTDGPPGLLKLTADIYVRMGTFSMAETMYSKVIASTSNLAKSTANSDITISPETVSIPYQGENPSHWVPIFSCLRSSTEIFLDAALMLSQLIVLRRRSKLPEALNCLRLAYSIRPSDPRILCSLADLGYIQDVRDLEDFYSDELRRLLPPSSITRQLLLLDPIIFVSPECQAKSEQGTLSAVRFEFIHNFYLLVKSLMIVARNSRRNNEISIAENLLSDAFSLLDLLPNKNNKLRYLRSNAVKVPDVLKMALLDMILNCSAINNHFDECIHYGKLYLELRPHNVDVLTILGDICLKKEHYNEAKKYYRSAISSLKNNQLPHELSPDEVMSVPLSIVLTFNETHDMEKGAKRVIETQLLEKLLEVAEIAVHEDLDVQKECLEQLCGYNLQNATLRYKLGLVCEKQKRLTEAEQMYARALKLDSKQTEAAYNLGRIHFERREFNKAFELFSRIYGVKSHNVDFLEHYAVSLQKSFPPRIDEALRFWKMIIDLEPSHIRALYHLGLLYYREKKDFRSAKLLMKRILKLKNSNTSSQPSALRTKDVADLENDRALNFLDRSAILLAELYVLEGEIQSAHEALSYSTPNSLNDHHWCLLKGIIALRQRNYHQSLERLQGMLKGIGIQPESERSRVLSLIAECHCRLGELGIALKFAKQSYSITPLAFHSLSVLSWVLAMSLASDTMNEPLRLARLAQHAEPNCPLPGLFEGYFRLLEGKWMDADILLRTALDKMLYVWTYDSLERLRCTKEWLTMCRIYILLCSHISSSSPDKYEDNALNATDIIEEREDAIADNLVHQRPPSVEEASLFEEITKSSKQISEFSDELRPLFLNHSLISTYRAVKSKIQCLQPVLQLHSIHWKLLSQLFFRYVYYQTYASNSTPLPSETLPAPLNQHCHPTTSPTNDTPVIRIQQAFRIFHKNDNLPIVPKCSSYSPFRHVYMPIHQQHIHYKRHYKQQSMERPRVAASKIDRRRTTSLVSKKENFPTKAKFICEHAKNRDFYDHELVHSSKIQVFQQKDVNIDSWTTALESLPPQSSLSPKPLCRPIAHMTPQESADSKSALTHKGENHCSSQVSDSSMALKVIPNPESMLKTSFAAKMETKVLSTSAQTMLVNLPSSKILSSGDITIGRRLGTGGFGTVYSGVLKSTKRQVAIKRLHFDSAVMKVDQVKDIMSEIQAIFHLKHRSLVEFIGIYFEPANVSIVTELCSNGSLHMLLHQCPRPISVSFSLRRRIALQLAEGVQFLHSLNPCVIHRDLKSLNVVIDSAWNAKICDFGLTTSMDGIKSHISLKLGAAGGSPRYMAPECFETKELSITVSGFNRKINERLQYFSARVSEKVDIWALGCILIEIFGGHPPFSDCTEVQHIMRKLLVDKQGPKIPTEFPRALRRIVCGCLRFDAVLRWDASKILSHIKNLPEFKIHH